MKTNPLTGKIPNGFWIIATIALFCVVVFLFFERNLWILQSKLGANDAGQLAARNDIRYERFQYLISDPSGHFDFTGELKDGVEVWSRGYAQSFPFTTPSRVYAESYVSAYNSQMEWHVAHMDQPPSAVKRRSAELTNEDPKVRERAAIYLGMMRAQAMEAVPHLIKATRDEIVEVRARATWALGKIGPGDYQGEVTEALELVRETPNAKMQEIASRALEEVSAWTTEARVE